MENKSNTVSWIDRDIHRFKTKGMFIPQNQINLYKNIRDNWVAGRTVIDVGCSAGYGSNILSHEARHVWGIDMNKEAVDFATHMYERPNLSFDVFDLENPPERPLSPFEVLIMIEVIEHVPNYDMALNSIKRFFNDKLNTVGFITIPNLNNERVRVADAKNNLHVNHWTPGEFYSLLTKHFKYVTMYGDRKLDKWVQEETIDLSDDRNRIVIAKVEGIL